jgi:hypothetical protein
MTGTERQRCCIGVGVAALLAAVPGTAAKAATIDLVAPIQDLIILEPPDPPPPGGPFMYGESGPSPNWNVAQWNIPGDKLSPFRMARVGNANGWVASASVMRVTLTRSGESAAVDLLEDGAALPCLSADRHPRELDLFLSPNGGQQNRPPAVQGMLALGANNPTLATMAHLYASGTVGVAWGVASSRKHCANNQGSALISIVLNDSHKQAGQTIFYQLNLDTFCLRDPVDEMKSCRGPSHGPVGFSRTNPFGFDDDLASFDAKPAPPERPGKLTVDLLPRLLDVVQRTGEAGDRDPSHWVVGGVYIGLHIWGDVTLHTTWSDFRLQAVTR